MFKLEENESKYSDISVFININVDLWDENSRRFIIEGRYWNFEES